MKILVPIFLPLFVSSLDHAEDMANGMEARGYQSGGKRSTFRQLTWHKKDNFFLGTIVLLTAVLVLLRAQGAVH